MRRYPLALGLAALASAGLLACALLGDEPPEPSRRYALVVGVQNYDGTALGNLRYSDNDAAGLADTLGRLGYHVTLMTRPAWKEHNRDDLLPTAENIRANLKVLLRDRQPTDTVLLAFAGHGEQLKKDGKMYFCPTKADLDRPETLVALDEVYGLLKDNAAGAKMLIVDACRNDPLAGRTTGSEKLESVTRPELPDPPGGTVALFSCSKGQVAYESDNLKHGYLFHFVIEGLNGKAANSKDGQITWVSLTKHVDDQLSEAVVHDLGAKAVQTPEVRGESHGLVVAQVDTAEKAEEFDYGAEGQTKKGKRRVLTLDLGDGVTMEFVHIRAGAFLMGASDSDKDAGPDEKPQHEVAITKDFYLGKYLVTRKQFARFVAAKGYTTEAEADRKGAYGFNDKKEFKIAPRFSWRNPGFEQGEDHPVVSVSWNDAKAFCDWAGEAAGRGVRLPTEAEWEYACRAGTTTRYPTGDAAPSLEHSANVADQSAKKQFPGWAVADFDDGFVFTSPVTHFRPNPWGLYDMTGNAYEWCSDYSDPKYYALSPKKDPEKQEKTEKRVVRGGAFAFRPGSCRAADRGSTEADRRACTIGFRVEFRQE